MRTITAVTPKDGQTILTLSDGTQYEFGSYSAGGPGGTVERPVFVVDLRDPASPTGSFLAETPTLTYEAAKLFEAAGITDTEVMETIAHGPEAPPVSVVASDPTPETPKELANPGVVISAEDHQKSKGILARIESLLSEGEQALVAELRAILKHV